MAQPETATRPHSNDSDRRPDPARQGTARDANDAGRAGQPARTPGDQDPGATAFADRQPADRRTLDPDERRSLIEYQAYLLYLQRGEGDGSELDDWLAAEREIDGRRE